MQLPEAHRRHPLPLFVNHTPRDFEITASNPSRPSDMPLGSFSMAFGAAPLYTNANMGQTSSEIQRPEPLRKASNSILREDSIYVEEERSEQSRPDSLWSIHCARTDQAPYTPNNGGEDDKMMTQTSFLTLPKGNASHDLAFFLRTTGPTAPHRRPSKIENQWRGTSGTKQALKFLKPRQKKRPDPVMTAHKRLNGAISYHDKDPSYLDEGGLLNDIEEEPPIINPLIIQGAEQKVSSTGKRYMALVAPYPPPKISPITDTAPVISPDVLDSHVSISFPDDMNSGEILDSWLLNISKERLPRFIPSPSPNFSFGNDLHAMNMPDSGGKSMTPIRPAASNPPTPLLPEPAGLDSDYYHVGRPSNSESPSDERLALRSHPVSNHVDGRSTPFNGFPSEDYLIGRSSPQKEARIVSPSPKRFVSHPVLLQRASSMSSSVYPPSAESPGPPPPKSPLRVLRDDRAIGDVMGVSNKPTPNYTPSSANVSTLSSQRSPIRPTVITDCTGPIKRPKSRTKDKDIGLVRQLPNNMSRKEREERIRARKLRDKPYVARTIDAVVNGPLLGSRRLKKARPQIQIPDLRPAPLVTRASSSASSAGSWRKVTESTRTPVSPVPSEDDRPVLVPGKQRTPISPVPSEPIGVNNEDKTGYTPITPSTTHTNNTINSTMTLSPVMLIAEEVPLPRIKPSPNATKIIVKEGKGYAPRPRSASMSRKRRSRTTQPQSRSTTPVESHRPKDPTPPLPSPPPNRCLPPTPPASGSERTGKIRPFDTKKDLPGVPLYELSLRDSFPRQTADRLPHVATQAQQRKSNSSKDSNKTSRVDARLEALEKQNALLSAALMAVLKTNGALNNGVRASAVLRETDAIKLPMPMAWECRIARRSAASHTASSSNGSALDMYMSTRQGGGRYGM